MSGMFGGKAPAPPPAPPPPPDLDAAQEAAAAVRRRNKGASTILTSAMGDPGTPTTAKNVLLGQ